MNTKKKVALITGITGQDGAYLAEYLLKKGYEVHGLKRRSSLFNTERVDHLYQDPHTESRNFFLHYGDLSDSMNITALIRQVLPDEIYNLGAMSHVKVSFESPEYTANVDGLGTLRILEAVRLLGLEKKTRIYQASTSELFGLVQTVPQNEQTPFYPRSPYACAKLYAYWITINYREAYGMHCSNGVLFNHESPLRGETFVTRKITRSVSRIATGLQQRVYLGNLSATRDWGHAKDYVRSMHMILQQDQPGDYVVATGITTSVRDFAQMSFAYVGMKLRFEGEGVDERGVLSAIDEEVFKQRVGDIYLPGVRNLLGQTLLSVDPNYFRPTEVQALIGDAARARKILGWEPEYTLQDIIRDMMDYDIRLMHKEAYLKEGGYQILNYFE
ncbi:GDP-mannose 4,6-dehydratase [Porphyromonas crevioricanis JCM 15906]|uniref:GDP-mannose 4,6-dehydratase n=1 Tax=Porphyromonas crevioricanis JCM 15906 TaxID=1305617 RepID=T1CNN8_9PORP|nr:GDP-mannose 4,6-dehydratase [Porphyromonas crevioricanis]GAD05457.1 GDP-mannose 4,6-dehydratase [Porphyromonas crevioricanis JCM 15906]SJZ88730.1 GDPmannose 4,6-dehydratase [Porphyromonas crevioricanis]